MLLDIILQALRMAAPVETLDGCLGSRKRPMLGADSSTVRAFVPSEPELMGEGGAYEGHFGPFPDVWDDPFKGFPQRFCPLFLQYMRCCLVSTSASIGALELLVSFFDSFSLLVQRSWLAPVTFEI